MIPNASPAVFDKKKWTGTLKNDCNNIQNIPPYSILFFFKYMNRAKEYDEDDIAMKALFAFHAYCT